MSNGSGICMYLYLCLYMWMTCVGWGYRSHFVGGDKGITTLSGFPIYLLCTINGGSRPKLMPEKDAHTKQKPDNIWLIIHETTAFSHSWHNASFAYIILRKLKNV